MHVNNIFVVSMCALALVCLLTDYAEGQAGKRKLVRNDCTIDWLAFEEDWKTYSDIGDDRVPLESKSPEAQNYHRVLEEIVQLKIEIHFLKRDIAIDEAMRNQLLDYKRRLVNNIRQNLVKSFIRLSYMTYTTVQAGRSLGQSYTKLFADTPNIAKLASSIKVVRGLTPQTSSVAIDTKTVKGKVKAVGVTGALDFVESLGDPGATAKALVQDMHQKALPTPDLTPEEINILKNQHLRNELINQVLADSLKENNKRNQQIKDKEDRIKQLELDLATYEQAEKLRVADMLVEDCKRRMTNDGTEDNTGGQEGSFNGLVVHCAVKYRQYWDNPGNATIEIAKNFNVSGTFRVNIDKTERINGVPYKRIIIEYKGSIGGKAEVVDRGYGKLLFLNPQSITGSGTYRNYEKDLNTGKEANYTGKGSVSITGDITPGTAGGVLMLYFTKEGGGQESLRCEIR